MNGPASLLHLVETVPGFSLHLKRTMTTAMAPIFCLMPLPFSTAFKAAFNHLFMPESTVPLATF